MQMMAMVEPSTDRLELRLENWGECYRRRGTAGVAASMEGRYRNAWRRSWDCDAIVGTAPAQRLDIDLKDGQVINFAWQSMPDAFHQTLLAAWYVKRWSGPHCVRVARETAGEPARRRNDGAIEAYLAMARALVQQQLDLPAVVRRERLVAKTRQALGLLEWVRVDFAANDAV